MFALLVLLSCVATFPAPTNSLPPAHVISPVDARISVLTVQIAQYEARHKVLESRWKKLRELREIEARTYKIPKASSAIETTIAQTTANDVAVCSALNKAKLEKGKLEIAYKSPRGNRRCHT